MENSKIEWTKHTNNLWTGCTKVHEGCDHCYAEALARRWNNDVWGDDKPRKEVKSAFNNFKFYQKAAAQLGEIHRVFVGSMMDIFEKPMPLVGNNGEPYIDYADGSPICTDYLRDKYFEEVIPFTPNLLHLLLTKRETNINKIIPAGWKTNPPQNIMYGASVVNQKTFDRVTKNLKSVNGRKFLSIEPQLEPIKLGKLEGIDWIICGGESGVKKRPFNTDWARSLRDECAALGIPYFFKQVDKVQEIPDDLQIRQFPAFQAA